jgi:hypothetical protein
LEEIPKYNHEKGDRSDQAPCWIPVIDDKGNKLKPVIVCKCGKPCGIGLHHVHSDGKVTASFYHEDGCGWHVFIKLLDYDRGEFLPNKNINN